MIGGNEATSSLRLYLSPKKYLMCLFSARSRASSVVYSEVVRFLQGSFAFFFCETAATSKREGFERGRRGILSLNGLLIVLVYELVLARLYEKEGEGDDPR